MADLYGTNAYSSSPSPSTTAFALDSEDISSFIHHLLHNSSTPPSSSCASFKAKHLNSFSSHPPPPPPPPETTSNAGLLEDRRRFCRSAILSDSDCRVRDETYAAGSSLVVDSSSSLNLSNPGGYSPADVKSRTENTFYSVGLTDSDAITSSLKPRKFPAESDVDEGTEVSEVPLNPVPPRASSSSKRSRAAEVHNLSEKRRRSRINEKMKALQNLIPNSNKTDKASMLDEAIEYLKQLQLQVQMLSMRNGFNLHPIYLPGVLQPMQLSQTGMGFDEGNGLLNTNRGTDTFSENQGTLMRTAFDLSNQCTPSNQSIVIPTMTNITKAENSFGLQPSVQAHSGPFNLSTSSKEICREDTLPHLQLDTSGSGKNS